MIMTLTKPKIRSTVTHRMGVPPVRSCLADIRVVTETVHKAALGTFLIFFFIFYYVFSMRKHALLQCELLISNVCIILHATRAPVTFSLACYRESDVLFNVRDCRKLLCTNFYTILNLHRKPQILLRKIPLNTCLVLLCHPFILFINQNMPGDPILFM